MSSRCLRLWAGHLNGSGGCGAEDPGPLNGEYDGKVFAGLQRAKRDLINPGQDGEALAVFEGRMRIDVDGCIRTLPDTTVITIW